MSRFARDLAALDRAIAANPPATSTGAPPFTDRWGRLPKRSGRPIWIHVPWPAIKRIAADERHDGGADWQRRGLEIVLRTPDLRKLLARRGGFLRKNPDGTWDFAASCYPAREGDREPDIATDKIPGARGASCLWWCKGKNYSTAWNGLSRELSAIADLAYAILGAARGQVDSRLIDGYQRWHTASGNETLCAGIISEAEGKRRGVARSLPTCAAPGCDRRVSDSPYCPTHES